MNLFCKDSGRAERRWELSRTLLTISVVVVSYNSEVFLKENLDSLKGQSLPFRRIVVVDNLEPRKLRGEISEGMLLAARAPEGDGLTLITTDQADFPSAAEVG